MYSSISHPQFYARQRTCVKIASDAQLGSLTDVEVPDYADSFCYPVEQHQIPAVRNRFLLWRSSGSDLHMSEHSLDLDLTEASVSIQFGQSSVLPGTSVHLSRDHVHVLVSTLHYVYSFALCQPTTLIREQQELGRRQRSSRLQRPISPIKTDGSTVSSVLAHFINAAMPQLVNDSTHAAINGGPQANVPILRSAGCLDASLRSIFALTFADASVLIITLPPFGQTLAAESSQITYQLIKPTSIMRRIFNGFPRVLTGSVSESADQPDIEAALAVKWHVGAHGPMLMMVTAHAKFSIWSAKNRDFAHSSFVRSYLPQYEETVFKSATIKVNVLGDLLIVGVMLTNACQSKILLLVPTPECTNVSCFAANSTPPDHTCIDFSFTDSHLWLLSADRQNRTHVFHAAISMIDGGRIDPWKMVHRSEAIAEPDESSARTDEQVCELYLNAILTQQRFSYDTVLRAIKVILVKQPPIAFGDVTALAEHLRLYVVQYAQEQVNAQGGTLTSQLSKCWRQLWSSCVQLHQASSQPLALLHCQPMEMYGVVLTKQLELFVPCHDVLNELGLRAQDLAVVDTIEVPDVPLTANQIHDHVERARRKLEADGYLGQLDTFVTNTTAINLRKYAQILSSCVESTGEQYDEMYEEMMGDVVARDQYSSCLASGLGTGALCAAVSDCIRQLIDACHLVVLATAHLDRSKKSSVYEECVRLLTPTLQVLYIASRSVNFAVDRQPCSTKQALFSILTDEGQRLATTLRSLMCACMLQSGGQPDRALIWGSVIVPYIGVLKGAIWPHTQTAHLAQYLLDQHHDEALYQYCRLLMPYTPVTSNAMKYMHAMALTRMHSFEQAHETFLSVASGVTEGDATLIQHLFTNIQNRSVAHLTAEYYIKVIGAFEEADSSEYAIRVAVHALERCPEKLPQRANLLMIVFKHQCLLGQYESALASVLKQPDDNFKMNSLRKLLTDLADRQQIVVIVQLQYADLENEASRVLESRARTCDVGKTLSGDVVNYYHVLYAFHLRRDKRARAAFTLCEWAQRLSIECAQTETMLRAVRNAFSTCLQLLSTVDPSHRWLAFNNTAYETKMETEPDVYEPMVVTLEMAELRIQWLLAEAALKLISNKHDRTNVFTLSSVLNQINNRDLLHDHVQRVVGSLCAIDQFDCAFTLSLAVDHHLTPSHLQLTQDVLQKLCIRAVALARNDTIVIDDVRVLCDGNKMYTDTSAHPQVPLVKVDHKHPSSFAWRLLQCYLLQLSQSDAVASMYATVTCHCLAMQHPLPVWLTDMHKAKDTPELIRCLAEFGQVADAIKLLLDYVDAVRQGDPAGKLGCSQQTKLLPAARCAVWLPYTIADQLIQLAHIDADPDAVKMARELDAKLSAYMQDVRRVSTG